MLSNSYLQPLAKTTGHLLRRVRLIGYLALVVAALATSGSKPLLAATKQRLSLQAVSMAPNAGGQSAFALRFANDSFEYYSFMNQYLQVNGQPYIGGGVDYLLPVCKKNCFWQMHALFGAGGSNGGPYANLGWSINIPFLPIWLPSDSPKYVPNLRCDFSTQLIVTRERIINWGYPFWLGISVPF